MQPTFFKSQADFRHWLERNHATKHELLIGFHKRNSGQPSITYPEALDEALSFGWIDGVRRSLNEDSYTIRFSRRRPKSIWSNVNVRHVERLKKLGRMAPAGLAAYEARDPKRTGIYSFENRPKELLPAYETKLRANKAAWHFFQQLPPGLKRTLIFWVMSAKREETRLRRLEQLITSSANGIRLGVITSKNKK